MADERQPRDDRRSGEERRKPRSSFVERVWRAKNRRSGSDRREKGDPKPPPAAAD
jgi:hypothetical protein